MNDFAEKFKAAREAAGLAGALRWQYDLGRYTVADALNCGARL